MKTKLTLVLSILLLIFGLISCEKESTQIQPADQDEVVNLKNIALGTGTIGYWKNHPEAWPLDEIKIGRITYSKEAAIEVMKTKKGKNPTKGDKTYDMFNQMVAARLNLFADNPWDCIHDTWWKANSWMKDYPLGSGVKASSDAWQEPFMVNWRVKYLTPPETASELHSRLDAYNKGELCATHRDDM